MSPVTGRGRGLGPTLSWRRGSPQAAQNVGSPGPGWGQALKAGLWLPRGPWGHTAMPPRTAASRQHSGAILKRACRSSGLDEGGVRESEGQRRSRAPPPSQLCRDRHPGGILGEGWGSWPGDYGHEVGVQPLGSRVTWPVGGGLWQRGGAVGHLTQGPPQMPVRDPAVSTHTETR